MNFLHFENVIVTGQAPKNRPPVSRGSLLSYLKYNNHVIDCDAINVQINKYLDLNLDSRDFHFELRTFYVTLNLFIHISTKRCREVKPVKSKHLFNCIYIDTITTNQNCHILT